MYSGGVNLHGTGLLWFRRAPDDEDVGDWDQPDQPWYTQLGCEKEIVIYRELHRSELVKEWKDPDARCGYIWVPTRRLPVMESDLETPKRKTPEFKPMRGYTWPDTKEILRMNKKIYEEDEWTIAQLDELIERDGSSAPLFALLFH